MADEPTTPPPPGEVPAPPPDSDIIDLDPMSRSGDKLDDGEEGGDVVPKNEGDRDDPTLLNDPNEEGGDDDLPEGGSSDNTDVTSNGGTDGGTEGDGTTTSGSGWKKDPSGYWRVHQEDDGDWVIQIDRDGPSGPGNSGDKFDWTTVAEDVDPDSVTFNDDTNVIDWTQVDLPPADTPPSGT